MAAFSEYSWLTIFNLSDEIVTGLANAHFLCYQTCARQTVFSQLLIWKNIQESPVDRRIPPPLTILSKAIMKCIIPFIIHQGYPPPKMWKYSSAGLPILIDIFHPR